MHAPHDYPWSSYRATADHARTPSFLSTDFILGQFSPSRKKAKKLYEQFVLSGTTKESPWKEVTGGLFLGPASFVDEIKDLIKSTSLEIPRRQRFAARPALGKLIPRSTKATDHQNTEARGYGYTLQEIGAHLGIHYATVSRRADRYKRQAKGKKRDAKNKT